MLDVLTHNLSQTVASGRLVKTSLPMRPDLDLYLLSEDYPRGPLPHDEMLAVLERPAYWAFCWASGQVLARYLRDHPALCRGRTVVDFGAGSGVVSVAAALAGAARVIACDLDPHALDASRVNAALNQVEVELLDDLHKLEERADLIIAADVLYDRDNLEWLDLLSQYGNEVLIADSRVRDPAVFEGYTLLDTITATTIPDLDEMKEFGRVSIYQRRYR